MGDTDWPFPSWMSTAVCRSAFPISKRRHSEWPFVAGGEGGKVSVSASRMLLGVPRPDNSGPTCSVDRRALQGEILHQDGRSLVDEHIHTLHVALEGGQVQGCAALAVPDVQVQQGLNQNLQSLVVPMVCLQTWRGAALKTLSLSVSWWSQVQIPECYSPAGLGGHDDAPPPLLLYSPLSAGG